MRLGEVPISKKNMIDEIVIFSTMIRYTWYVPAEILDLASFSSHRGTRSQGS